MLRGGGGKFGLGCGGASVADVLATRHEPSQVALTERLASKRAPIVGIIAGRKVELHLACDAGETATVNLPVRVGKEACRLNVSLGLVTWIGQSLGLEGVLTDEQPLQRDLLLEAASLDLIRQIEAHVGEDIRFGEGGESEIFHSMDIAVGVDGLLLSLRMELTERLAEVLLDFLDQLQPPTPEDLSAVKIDLVVEAGSQDLSVEELASLSPGDVIMLEGHRLVAVANGALAAPVRRRSDGIELDGAFYPRSRRAMVGSLADIRAETDGAHLVHLVAEVARMTLTVGAMDALQPRQALPLSSFDETGVDLVVDNRRFGRGELIMIGVGMGARVISLSPEAEDRKTS